MDRARAFEACDEGSNPSGGTNLIGFIDLEKQRIIDAKVIK